MKILLDIFKYLLPLLLLLPLLCVRGQMILHPTAYDQVRQDISLDATPKCQACRHVIASLRNHFAGATSLSPTSIVYEADPCVMSPPGVAGWCSDVNKKLLQCPIFIEKIFDRSQTAVKICESCAYDQFPLPPVRFCDNSLYMSIDAPPNDKCSDCIDIIKRIQISANPCERLTPESCTELQTALSRCASYNKFIHQPFADARRMCEECAVDLPDGTSPPGMLPNMYCDRPTASPLLDNSICSMCVNVVHNVRNFPMENPCKAMPDEQCSYIQDRLMQCTIYNRMIDQHQYSALSVCEQCTDNRNPLTPLKFCSGELRANSPNPVDPFAPSQQSAAGVSFFKPEPPAPFPSPWWLKQQAAVADPNIGAGGEAQRV
eukprot:gnl/Hemi2/1780_TR630_c0_g1_i1.p1 gnl/Hemi2/1780_TR630_c0_g1~~gnl/Hemi2/1780_TR630_c0_g1_i1.p1  ORF type:complete len:420 (-),score=118.51 gnl/Hemi2/1780_TR630_c0_g1_i1:10-1134(-)